tara:strand:+ start:1006 stop:1143 length:138 start_codon:yes stop_codon:yes gene_type:complete
MLASAASIVGTLWFVLLIGVLAFVAGIWARPYAMKLLKKDDCCKK